MIDRCAPAQRTAMPGGRPDYAFTFATQLAVALETANAVLVTNPETYLSQKRLRLRQSQLDIGATFVRVQGHDVSDVVLVGVAGVRRLGGRTIAGDDQEHANQQRQSPRRRKSSCSA